MAGTTLTNYLNSPINLTGWFPFASECQSMSGSDRQWNQNNPPNLPQGNMGSGPPSTPNPMNMSMNMLMSHPLVPSMALSNSGGFHPYQFCSSYPSHAMPWLLNSQGISGNAALLTPRGATSTSTTPTATVPPPSPPTEEKKHSDLHALTLHPPGMPRPFDVCFPERRLPVCSRCKKNYKSRDLCRTRDGHKDLPWTTTYIVITLDKTCFVEANDGTISYAEVTLVSSLMDTPLLCLGPDNGTMALEPICRICREKNYTRDYCRNICKHTTPPWSTIYVELKPVLPSTRTNEHFESGGPGSVKRRKKNSFSSTVEEWKAKSDLEESNASGNETNDKNDVDDEVISDDLTVIHPSRTFLAAVSSKSVVFRWCQRIQHAESANENAFESILSSLPLVNNSSLGNDSHRRREFAVGGVSANFMRDGGGLGNNGMPPSIHLWEAFRAGVLWAQSQNNHMTGNISNPGGGVFGGMPTGRGIIGNPFSFFGQPPSTADGMGPDWLGGMFGVGAMNMSEIGLAMNREEAMLQRDSQNMAAKKSVKEKEALDKTNHAKEDDDE